MDAGGRATQGAKAEDSHFARLSCPKGDALRPPWMAEGRTTQEQLSRCAE